MLITFAIVVLKHVDTFVDIMFKPNLDGTLYLSICPCYEGAYS
jgi:hypothetical protein